jgi:hypothetical protein
MRFEAHQIAAKCFVAHENKNMIHKFRSSDFVIHK